MTHEALLEYAKTCLNTSAQLPYPADLVVAPWWKEHQHNLKASLVDLKTVKDVVRRAQTGTSSGFDHREFERNQLAQTINFKCAELRQRFQSFNLEEHEELTESKYSAEESLLDCGNGKMLSSIYLTHLYFYLRTTQLCDPKMVLEIGSGYGGLARIFHTMRPDLTYILVDLPESLFQAQIFLEANFPNSCAYYVTDGIPEDLTKYQFVFVPAQIADRLKGLDVDLVINTGSFQEMTSKAMLHWMNFVHHTINTKYFFSWNYFLNDKSDYAEARSGTSVISPIIDAFWFCHYFKINDPVITVDCDGRNWLEVFLERIPKEQQPHLNRVEYANKLIEAANSFRAGTNPWFQNMWMAIWVNTAPEFIDAMVTGISFFVKNKCFGIQNYCVETKKDLGEVIFYKDIKAKMLGLDTTSPSTLPSE